MARVNQSKEYTENQITGFLNKSRINATDVFEAPPIILKVDDSIIGTLGNFSSSTGKAKSKKTFNISAIAAAAIKNGKVLNYSASLPEGKQNVILIDTEQSKFHCKRVIDRILKMSGYEKGVQPPNFSFYGLRPYSPALRILIIEQIIKISQNIGLIIIDGIRDLAYDINNSHEATEVITKLMQWTEIDNIHIHTVLHQNKTDNNSRGHLGTELNNKSETVLKITVPDNQKEVSIVESEFIRDRDFEPFAFSINEAGLPEIDNNFECSVSSTKKDKEPIDYGSQTHYKFLNDIYSNGKKTEFSFNEMCVELKKTALKYNIKLADKMVRNFVHFYSQNGYLDNLGSEKRNRLIYSK